jgi:four helix bundle protein
MWTFQALETLQDARRLAAQVYRVSAAFPERHRREATSRLRQASIRIPAGIAEACGTWSDRKAVRWVRAALQAAAELEFQLLLARDVELLNAADYRDLSLAVSDIRRALIAQLGELRAGG